MAFSNPVKLIWYITRRVCPQGNTNQNWLDAKLLPMAISIYPVVCVYSCHLLRAQYHCLWPNGREGPPSACPPLPPPTHTLISVICDIIGVVKNYLKNQQWIMHGRVSYKTVAISLLYLYSKSCMAIMQHRRTTIVSMLQKVFLKIQNVTLWLIFPNPVAYLWSILENTCKKRVVFSC